MTGRHRAPDTLLVEANVIYVDQGKTYPCTGAWGYTTCDPLVVSLTVWPADLPLMHQFPRHSLATGLMGVFLTSQPVCVDWAKGTLDVEMPSGWVTVSAQLSDDFLAGTHELAPECPFPAFCEDQSCIECSFTRLAVASELRNLGLGVA